jgi:hypothetical protein
MEEEEKQESNSTLDFLNSEVGENEGSQALEPGEVVIASIQMKTHNKQEKKMDNPLVEVHCKHPDREELIKLTQIKRISGEKMINVALFATVDKDGKLFKDSGIASLLSFVGVSKLKDLEGHKIEVVKESETSKYLALKCYK